MQNKRSETCNQYNKQTKQLTRRIINKQNHKPKKKKNSNWVKNLKWKFMNLGKVGTMFNTSKHGTLKLGFKKIEAHTTI